MAMEALSVVIAIWGTLATSVGWARARRARPPPTVVPSVPSSTLARGRSRSRSMPSLLRHPSVLALVLALVLVLVLVLALALVLALVLVLALLVVGCWLSVVGCRLSVVGCWLLVVL